MSTGAFGYVNLLKSAADASWTREEVLTNNIANVDTPNYKRQDVDFEGELQRALGNSKYTSMDEKVSALKTRDLTPRTYTDSANFSYRLDGNNVDIDTENVTLASNELKYNGIMGAVQTEFANLKTAMSGS